MKTSILVFIPQILELLAALVATFTFSKYKFSTERVFLFFLWFTVLIELLGTYIGYILEVDNFWVYNFFTVTSFLIYFYWYYNLFKENSYKSLAKIFMVFIGVTALLSALIQDWDSYYSYTFIIGALMVLVLTVFHFYKLLNSNAVLIVNYKLSFWISVGLLLFYLGMVPTVLLAKVISLKSTSYFIVLASLNLVLYSSYIIGFIWTKKKYNHF